MVLVSYPQKIDIYHLELFCRSIKEEYPPCIVLLDFKRDYAAPSMKAPRRFDFCNTFQHLSLYSNQFAQNLNKLHNRIFRKNNSIYYLYQTLRSNSLVNYGIILVIRVLDDVTCVVPNTEEQFSS